MVNWPRIWHTAVTSASATSPNPIHNATNIPITVDRHIKVTSTHGNTAVVSDDITLKAGSTTLPNDHVYAVNRKTLNATTPPKGATVDPASGLTVAFPLSPRANNSYRYYDSASQLTVQLASAKSGEWVGVG